jgi:hypothetical protein
MEFLIVSWKFRIIMEWIRNFCQRNFANDDPVLSNGL